MKNIRFIFMMSFLLFSVNLLAQKQVTVTGTVVDQNKEPLIGVNITVKDQPGFGVITNIDGKYSIKVQQFSTLIYSYIGFDKQEILVKNQKVINVRLKESSESILDEVVITGTGSQKKITVTGAITNVNMSELAATPSANITNSLAGNVAGVMAMQTSGQPGKNTSEFWIRGISTFGANSSALVLVDGFERSLDEVNIEDIESFSVLKDASSTAIYGPRGANGVVLITTKHGKPGKINIQTKFQSSYNSRTITPEMVDGYHYAQLLNEACITRNREPIYKPEELELIETGLDPDIYPNVDWQDVLLKDGAMTNRATLNLSGGSSSARYYVSLGYLNEEGMFKTDDAISKDYNTNANSQLWTYRLNTDINILKSTLLKVGISGSLKKNNEPGHNENLWNSMINYSAVKTPVIYSNGTFPSLSGTDTNYMNPWVMATQTGYREIWDNKIQSNISLEQKLDFITKGLCFVGRFGFDTNNSNTISRIMKPELWYARLNRDQQGEIIYDRVSEEQKMTQSSSSSGYRTESLEAILKYNKNFKGHRVAGTLKYTWDSKVTTVNVGSDIKNGIAVRHMGLAGRVAYNWKYRYFADFNFGYNGSENFAKGHKFGFFPAFSLAWNIAEEKFVKDNFKFFNMLKLRYSYGKVGNANLGERFPYLYTVGNQYYNNDVKKWLYYPGYKWGALDYNNLEFNGMRYIQLASENVTWEVATKHDVGLDLSMFNDKFSATIDYFHEQRDGIYQGRGYLPYSVGVSNISNPKANTGSVLSKGFDGNFAFKTNVSNVKLTIRGNMTYSKNTILEKNESYTVYSYQLTKGYQVGQQRGLIALGLFKDYKDIRTSPKQQFGEVMPGDIKYKDVNGDGVINDGDKVAIGSTARPSVIYGAGISMNWKGFDVNLHFQGAGKSSFIMSGGSVYAFSNRLWGNIYDGVTDDRWISQEISGDPATENPNASYPRLSFDVNSNNQRASTFWMRDGSYLRLKTLEIGYSLPKTFVRKIRFNNIRLFFIGTNLLTFSKFKLWDPEMGSGTGAKYPISKTLTLGLNVTI